MNEEIVVQQLFRGSLLAGEVVMKSFYMATVKAHEIHSMRASNHIPFKETSWKKMLATAGQKDVQEFMTNYVNLAAFKDELKKYGVGFAFKEQEDGKTLLMYHFKNKAIVERALSDVLLNIQDKPRDFTKKVLKTPKNMTVKEKLAYYQKEAQRLSTSKTVSKAKGKTTTLNSPVISSKGGKTI
ncbi:DUF3801 domain-containing protein [Streptococcus cameli]